VDTSGGDSPVPELSLRERILLKNKNKHVTTVQTGSVTSSTSTSRKVPIVIQESPSSSVESLPSPPTKPISGRRDWRRRRSGLSSSSRSTSPTAALSPSNRPRRTTRSKAVVVSIDTDDDTPVNTKHKKHVIRSDSSSHPTSPYVSNTSSSEQDTVKPQVLPTVSVKPTKPTSCLTPRNVKPSKIQPPKSSGAAKGRTAASASATSFTPTTTLTFLSSLTLDTPEYRCHPDARQYLGNFNKKREELGRRLYHLYNKEIFQGCLPADMQITWNVRLTKTAGLCYSRKYKNKLGVESRSSRIELSSKVIDSGDRLRDTLVHEMCHAASWIISGYRDGHGPLWRTWAEKAMQRFPELPIINRCHSYEIRTKYSYVCQKCGYTIGRHSKSLDTEKKVCGHCHGRFELRVNNNTANKNGSAAGTKASCSGGTPARTPNAFAMFVKDNYKYHKKPGVSHKDVMASLSAEFSKVKLNKA